GALPGPGDFPSAVWLLMILPMLPVGLGAVRLVRDVAHLERRERIIAWCAYPAAVVVAGLLLAGLSTGGIGDGRLVHLGPQMSTLALPLIGVVVVSTGGVLAVLATPLLPWARGMLGSVREKVEAAEREEQGGSGATGTADAGGGAESERSALLERFARRNPPATAVSAPSRGASASSATDTEEQDDDAEGDVWTPAPQGAADDETADPDPEASTGAGDAASTPDPSTRKTWLSRRRDR